MSGVLPFSFTLYGQPVQGIVVPIGSSVLFTLLLEDPVTRNPIDLTVSGTGVVSSLAALNIQGQPIQPPTIARQATITGSPVNQCTVAWAPSDTVPSGVPVTPGAYAFDVWTTDPDGNRLQNCGTVQVTLVLPATLPSTEVTPLPSTAPLGLGLPGSVLRWKNTQTWVDFWAAFAVPGGGGIIQVEGSADGSPRAIGPSANYPLSKFRLVGVPGQAIAANDIAPSAVAVTVASGVTLDDQVGTLTTLDLENISLTASAALCASGTTLVSRLNASMLLRTGDFSVFPSVTAANVTLVAASAISNNGNTVTAPFIGMVANAFIEATTLDGSFIDVATFGGDSTTAVVLQADDESYELNSNPANVVGAAGFSFIAFGANGPSGAVDVDIGSGQKQHRVLTFADIAAAIPVIAQGTVAPNTFVKNGTVDGTFTTLLKTDAPALQVGICTAGGTNGQQILVLFLRGVRATVAFDGVGSPAIGGLAYYSTTTDGFVTTTVGDVAGVFQSTAFSGTVDIIPATAASGTVTTQQVFSPFSYGAVGDGSHDDGPAIQSAGNAAIAVGGILDMVPGPLSSDLGGAYRIATPVVWNFPSNTWPGFMMRCYGDAMPIIPAVGVDGVAIQISGLIGEWGSVSIFGPGLTFLTGHLSSDGSMTDCATALAIICSSSESVLISAPIKAVGVSSKVSSGRTQLFHFQGGNFDIAPMKNAGCYVSGGDPPVYGFIHLDSNCTAKLRGVTSFGEYNWFGADNNSSGLGGTDALVLLSPSQSSSWGPSNWDIENFFPASRDNNALYCFPLSGSLNASNLKLSNFIYPAGGNGGAILSQIDNIDISDGSWTAGAGAIFIDAYTFQTLKIRNDNTAFGNTVPNVRGDGSGVIELADVDLGTLTTGGGRASVSRAGMRGSTVGAALTITSNTIAPLAGIHSVGAGLIKNITAPYTGFTGTVVLRPTVAFTYDATGNILVASGGGTAVVGKDMYATCDGSKWAMSY